MRQDLEYRNSSGREFAIRVTDVPTPAEADHWRYALQVKNKATGKQRTFTAAIKKAFMEDQERADMFIQGDPLTELQRRLDVTDDDGTWLDWPDLSRGWFIF